MGNVKARKRLRAEERREVLLEAAQRLFAQEGFEGARMSDIARATGVTKPVLYRHFSSKEDLFDEIVRDGCRRLVDAMDEALREDAPPDVMTARAVRVWFDFVASHEAMFRLVTEPRPGSERAAEAVAEVRDELVERIVEAFRPNVPRAPEGFDPGDWERVIEGTVRAIVGSAEAIAGWWARDKPYPLEVAWLTVTNLVWLGLERLLDGELWALPE